MADWDKVRHISISARDKDHWAEWHARVPGFPVFEGCKARSPDVLKRWQEHFEALNINYTPITDCDYGSVLTFRDPDGRQSQMFYRAYLPARVARPA